jgi:glycosyltransferase involved in cell wall biosynthesis
MSVGVSIIICTFKRPELLNECLTSFTQQTYLPSNIEFLVIDNSGDTATKEIVSAFQTSLPGIKYLVENKVGLSFARNRGIVESKNDWICYTDDDAKVHADFIERLIHTITHFEFDAFGGMFYPWYRNPKPDWFPNEFGTLRILRTSTGTLKFGQSIAGGISAFKKDKLIEAGGFPTEIGMRGNTVGYGEEDFVVKKMWANGCVIGFDPHWKMDHLVAEYKYTLHWQLKRSFAKGRDAQLKKASLSVYEKLLISIRAFLTIPYLFLINGKCFFKKRYYIQNYILDSLRYSIRLFGKISA